MNILGSKQIIIEQEFSCVSPLFFNDKNTYLYMEASSNQLSGENT